MNVLKKYLLHLVMFVYLFLFSYIVQIADSLRAWIPLNTTVTSNQSLEGRAATAEFQWQRHPRAAMAAAAADAPHHIATLTLEDEDRRGATKVFGGPAAGRTERETESEREREGRGSGSECLVCGALFSSQDKLRLHSFCHAGEKPFHCSQPHCPKAFSSKYKLFR